MQRAAVIAPVVLCSMLLVELLADSPRTVRYPRVYGATGRPYGPMQAHYQYQKQYGRPWHGYGGQTVQLPHGTGTHWQTGYAYRAASYYVVPSFGYYGTAPYGGAFMNFGYGAAVGPPGYADYGPVYSYIPMAPLVIQAYPEFIGKDPFDNAVLKQTLRENVERWGRDLILNSQPKTVGRPIRESTPEAKLRSLQAQRHGDRWFKKGEYQHAYTRYKRAVTEADDRAEAHFRLAYSLIALGYYDRAIREIKRGLRIDPNWPVTGESLTEIYGPDNLLEKSITISEVVHWARADVRDPDRLFLVGVLLHFDDDERAARLFDAALRLSGGGEHLLAFLKTDKSDKSVSPAPSQEAAPPPNESGAPVPESDMPPPPLPKP